MTCLRLRLLEGADGGPSRERGAGAELLLDAKQLVVFADAVGAAGRAGLDLARGGADREVGDGASSVSPERCEMIVA